MTPLLAPDMDQMETASDHSGTDRIEEKNGSSPVARRDPIRPASEGQFFQLGGVDWATYRTISEALTGRHLHITYDRGVLELMTISGMHGRSGHLLGLFIFVLAEEFNLPFLSFGDMTLNREDLDRGVEPDDSYYFLNEPLVRDKIDIDLSKDPPPDLMVEIDISRSSDRRLSIYAAMKVPEVWQYNGSNLRILRLNADGIYVRTEHSRYFGSLPIQELATFMARARETSEIVLVREFREWVREHLKQQS